MKRKFNAFLKILVAIMLLTSIIITTLFSTTNAEFFKSFNKKLDLELVPDLRLQYYLRDSISTSAGSGSDQFNKKYGYYDTAEGFSQTIVIGKNTAKKVDGTNLTYGGSYLYCGQAIVYAIAIPVDEPGYYNLNFTCCFVTAPSKDASVPVTPGSRDDGTIIQQDYPTINYNYAVGCEILTDSDIVKDSTLDFYNLENWGATKFFNMENRIYESDSRTDYRNGEKVLYSDSGTDAVYQWKTLCPSRTENVSLAFKVTADDVARGYVIWMWDLNGLLGERQYRFECSSLLLEKTMNLDGTTETRSNSDPYFMFPQTSYVNNQVYLYNQNTTKDGKITAQGSTVPGRTQYSDGRGSFVTAATDNSLTMQVEKLEWGEDTSKNPLDSDNPVGIYIPMKNIKAGTTYKVVFDFSIARQGEKGVDDTVYIKTPKTQTGDLTTSETINGSTNTVAYNWYDYADFKDILRDDFKEHMFQSYISTTISGVRNADNHKNNQTKITYNNKTYQSKPLTQYDEVTMIPAGGETGKSNLLDYTTSTSVNDTYSKIPYQTDGWNNTTGRNWFNAIQHTEYNGQNAINWLTFYNTSFSFNIKSINGTDKTAGNVITEQLYWIWAIDSLLDRSYYRIKIENVRIEEVVEYAAGIDENGVKIGGIQVNPKLHANSYTSYKAADVDTNVFYSLRGFTGTGQNYQARGHAVMSSSTNLTTKITNSEMMPKGNIYVPTLDARKLPVVRSGTSEKDSYKIELSGWVMCKGGVNKYVFSVDGGKTWNDMEFSGNNSTEKTNATEKDLYKEAAACISPVMEQVTHNWDVIGNATYKYVDFNEADGDNRNCRFAEWSLVADLSEYAGETYLDIIFAAVPIADEDMRCEFLRIINYNTPSSYVAKVEGIYSDISNKIDSTTNRLSMTNSGSDDSRMDFMSLYASCSSYSDLFVDAANKHYYYNMYPVSDIGVYSHYMYYSPKIDYFKVHTVASNFPVKTKLTLSGGIVAWYGVAEYCYSVDGGRTWNTIRKDTDPGAGDLQYIAPPRKDQNNHSSTTAYQKLFYKWLQRTTSDDAQYFDTANNANKVERNNGYNGQNGAAMLDIDLSAYAGQTVDVLIAAKSAGRYPIFANDGSVGNLYEDKEAYLPIARVDAVSVFGDATTADTNDRGTFYTRINSVELNSGTSNAVTLAAKENATDGTRLDGTSKWGRGTTPLSSTNSAYNVKNSYTIFEANNTDIRDTRLYSQGLYDLESGGTVTIKGFTMCKNGVNRYKYSFDGGKTWTVINALGADHNADRLAVGQKFDSSFTSADEENGAYNEGNGLRFTVDTTGLSGEKSILVVAESNKSATDKSPSGKLYPIAHFRVNIAAS